MRVKRSAFTALLRRGTYLASEDLWLLECSEMTAFI
jgi:hypothetical protein